MSYAFVQDVAASWEQYERFSAALRVEAPAGLIAHVAGPTDEGFRMIDIWAGSEQEWRKFQHQIGQTEPAGLARFTLRAFEIAHAVFPSPSQAADLAK